MQNKMVFVAVFCITIGGTQIFVRDREKDVLIHKKNESTAESFRKVNGWNQAVPYRCHAERIAQLAQKWGLKKK